MTALVLLLVACSKNHTPDSTLAATTSVETIATETTVPATTAPPPSCVARVVKVHSSLAVHSEPKLSARVDDRLPPDANVCVALTSKDGKWLYVRYAKLHTFGPEECNSRVSECGVGWISASYTKPPQTDVNTPASDSSAQATTTKADPVESAPSVPETTQAG